ncbi:selenide, water dikinase SelD [Rhodobacteraceae bacterium]|nr:selenide, water dikinase SelD [Paracoccaceae bacterium]
MHAAVPFDRDLVLIGGGVVHAMVLRILAKTPLPGVRLTLISSTPTVIYAPMLPGYIAGHYSRAQIEIDLVELARCANARLIVGDVDRLDPEARVINLASRSIAYDVASINIAPQDTSSQIEGFKAHGIAMTPQHLFIRQWDAFRLAQQPGRAVNITVIGGDMEGGELAMAMAHAMKSETVRPQITVVEQTPNTLNQSATARDAFETELTRAGIGLRKRARARRIDAQYVELSDSTLLESDFTLAPVLPGTDGWPARSGLATENGSICVACDLRVDGIKTLFAVGQAVQLPSSTGPMGEDVARRAAPVLARNLRALLSGGKLHMLKSTDDSLRVITLGGKRALGIKGGRSFSGAGLWHWKDRKDRAAVRQFARLTRTHTPARGCATDTPKPASRRVTLRHIMTRRNDHQQDNAYLMGPAHVDPVVGPDDTRMILQTGGRQQVLCTAQPQAIVADPGGMTRITLHHALGDLWSAGAVAQTAMLTVILPPMSSALQQRTMAEVLETARDVMARLKGSVAGVSMLEGAQMSIGCSLSGLVPQAAQAITYSGAKPGDVLVLTRPVGSGVIFAAHNRACANGEETVRVLTQLEQSQAAEAAILAHHATAMTHVGQFGLAGHLQAMCRASGCGAEVSLEDIPFYHGAEALAHAGIRSHGFDQNRTAAPVSGGSGARLAVMHDRETAGGLLAAVPAGVVDDVLARLHTHVPQAAIIGRIVVGPADITCV